jgi:hypothetical protein
MALSDPNQPNQRTLRHPLEKPLQRQLVSSLEKRRTCQSVLTTKLSPRSFRVQFRRSHLARIVMPTLLAARREINRVVPALLQKTEVTAFLEAMERCSQGWNGCQKLGQTGRPDETRTPSPHILMIMMMVMLRMIISRRRNNCFVIAMSFVQILTMYKGTPD